ncbi:MAG: recombinase family protein, partial [Coprococcus sp.]
FPQKNVRFIAINDNYDSLNHHGNTIELDTAFKTLLYDLYSKDISAKVKTSLENKCSNGEYVFGQPPFGYKKSSEVKNCVVVDEEEAKIVRYIFSLAIRGKSSAQIVGQLHDEHIPTITQMRKPDKADSNDRILMWSETAVRRILNNRFYLGEMAYGKSVRQSVGSRKSIPVPKENWKIIHAHHEPLITDEMFLKAAAFNTNHSNRLNRKKHPLTGKLYCGGCGYALTYRPLTGRNRYRRFECKKHAILQITECCTYIRADLLEQIILLMFNNELRLCGNAIRLKENLHLYQQAVICLLKKKKDEYRLEIEQEYTKKSMLYEKYAFGELDGEEYRITSGELTKQISSLTEKADKTEDMITSIENEYLTLEEDMELICRFLHIEELTQILVDTFIKKIDVYKDRRIEVEWNFAFIIDIN